MKGFQMRCATQGNILRSQQDFTSQLRRRADRKMCQPNRGVQRRLPSNNLVISTGKTDSPGVLWGQNRLQVMLSFGLCMAIVNDSIQHMRRLWIIGVRGNIGLPLHQKARWRRRNKGAKRGKITANEFISIQRKNIGGSIATIAVDERLDYLCLNMANAVVAQHVDRQSLLLEGHQDLECSVKAAIVDKCHKVQELDIVANHRLYDVGFILDNADGNASHVEKPIYLQGSKRRTQTGVAPTAYLKSRENYLITMAQLCV
jgi:hypothetical protein